MKFPILALIALPLSLVATESLAQSQLVSRIYIVDHDGQNLQLVADENALEDHTFLGSPSMSHDGKWVVFDATKNRIFSKTRLVKIGLNGPDKGKVIDLGTGLCSSFSPDDKQIAHFLNGKNPEMLDRGTYIMNLDGTNRKKVGTGIIPQWSPDGSRLLAVNSFRSPRYLLMVDLKEDKQRRILKDQIVLGLPTWSPDGKQFAVTVRDGEERALCVFGSDDPQKKKLELWRGSWDEGYEETWPEWSADGKTILFSYQDNELRRVRVMTVNVKDGAEPEELALGLGKQSIRDCAWSSDQKRILFAAMGDEIYELATPYFE